MTSSSQSHPRQPKGTPVGGQFAGKANPDADTELDFQSENGVMEHDGFQNYTWKLNGRLHRLDGPAIERVSNARAWYINGKRHRVGGPAVIGHNAYEMWYQNDAPHRLLRTRRQTALWYLHKTWLIFAIVCVLSVGGTAAAMYHPAKGHLTSPPTTATTGTSTIKVTRSTTTTPTTSTPVTTTSTTKPVTTTTRVTSSPTTTETTITRPTTPTTTRTTTTSTSTTPPTQVETAFTESWSCPADIPSITVTGSATGTDTLTVAGPGGIDKTKSGSSPSITVSDPPAGTYTLLSKGVDPGAVWAYVPGPEPCSG